MSNFSRRFKLSALSAAVLAVNGMAHAQEESDTSSLQEEELVVTGIRGALQRSIDDKRDAQNIVDTINAEDIGKTTDQNIADSLGRVTGVTVVSQDGEGTRITVRGATSSQNVITLNGQQLTSTDVNQSVDLSSFSSDILSKLEVVKTPSADHDEGSLGASVNLVTVRPLDQAEDTYSVTAQGRYSDFSEEFNHKLQFSMSKKFFDDTFGVTATIYDETNAYRKDQLRIENWQAIPTDVRIARDQHGELISDFRAIMPTAIAYDLNTDTSDRQGINLGLQWAPTDVTELMFNATYSEQTQERVRSSVSSRPRTGRTANFHEGDEAFGFDDDTIPTYSDPQEDWWTVDTDTRTFTQMISRRGDGSLQRSVGGSENTNGSAVLEIKHELTDRLRLSAAAGYSVSEQVSLPNAWTSMQNFNQVTGNLLFEAGEDIQPVGFRSDGEDYFVVSGTSIADLGDNVFEADNDDDNIIFTGFNPADSATFHLASINETDNVTEDSLSSVQFDIDFDLDLLGFTTLEFGAKATSRTKDVDQQSFQYVNAVTSETVFDEESGSVIVGSDSAFDRIRADRILLDGGLEYDNFMSALGYDRDNANSNFQPIDVLAALDLVRGTGENRGDFSQVVNPLETRATDLDTSAIYLKQNFSFLDDRLTGDVGVRYVETEIATSGFSGATWHTTTNHNDGDFSTVDLRDLRDMSLPACPEVVRGATYADEPVQLFEQQFQRTDGLGWDTSQGTTFDPSTGAWDVNPEQWTRLPDVGPCHDPAYAEYVAARLDDTPDADQDLPAAFNWQTLRRYSDQRVAGRDYHSADINNPNPTTITWAGTFNPDIGARAVGGALVNTDFNYEYTNLSQRTFAVTDEYEYSNVLPSLNLSFAFTDDLILRGAVSKTMTRPEFEDTRAGFVSNNSAYWGGGTTDSGRVNMTNTRLDPLESKNLDISLEWYFNDASLISVALFQKDMSNFITDDTARGYVADLRDLGPDDSFSAADFILAPDSAVDQSALVDESGRAICNPLTPVTEFLDSSGDTLRYSFDVRDLCTTPEITQKVNGENAEILGVELGYSQTYDFLPGFLGGTGMSANYTYQDSQYSDEISAISGELVEGLPVADTPEHTYNLTAFWESGGHQVRLSYRGQTDSLVDRDFNINQRGRTWRGSGSLWNEGRDTLDLSATYAVNDYFDITFQAINITDAYYRQYYTSRNLDVVATGEFDSDGNRTYSAYDEGNPLDGGVTKDRTVYKYNVGATYRLGLRVNF